MVNLMRIKILWILMFSLILLPFVNASYIINYDEYVDGNSFCSIYTINYQFDYFGLQHLENYGVVQLNDPDQSAFLRFQPLGSYPSMNCEGTYLTAVNVTIFTHHNQYWWPEMSTVGGTIGGIYMSVVSGQNYTVMTYEKNITYTGSLPSGGDPIYFNEAGGPFPAGASFHHGDTATAAICINFNQSIESVKDLFFDLDCRGTFVPFLTNINFPKKVGAKVCTEELYNTMVNITQGMSDSQAGAVEIVGGFSNVIYEVWLVLYWILRIAILIGVLFGIIYIVFWVYNWAKKVIEE